MQEISFPRCTKIMHTSTDTRVQEMQASSFASILWMSSSLDYMSIFVATILRSFWPRRSVSIMRSRNNKHPHCLPCQRKRTPRHFSSCDSGLIERFCLRFSLLFTWRLEFASTTEGQFVCFFREVGAAIPLGASSESVFFTIRLSPFRPPSSRLCR